MLDFQAFLAWPAGRSRGATHAELLEDECFAAIASRAISGTAVMFAGNNPSSTLHSLQAILTSPEFLWELSLGAYCAVFGFRRDSPIVSGNAPSLPGTAPLVSGSPA